MTSIIKVDQIQTAAGGVPTAADLGLDQQSAVLNVWQNTLNSTQILSSDAYVDITSASFTVTPQSVNSRFLIEGVCHVYFDENYAGWQSAPMRLLKDAQVIRDDTGGTSEYGSGVYGHNDTHFVMMKTNISAIHAPQTTSSITFKMQTRNRDAANSNGFNLNQYGTGYFRVIELAS